MADEISRDLAIDETLCGETVDVRVVVGRIVLYQQLVQLGDRLGGGQSDAPSIDFPPTETGRDDFHQLPRLEPPK